MAHEGKRLLDSRKKVDSEKLYDLEEALGLVKEVSTAKFDETIECHIRTGVDPRHADQMVRGSTILPAGTGKRVRVLAFAQGDMAREAEEAGADFVGFEDLIQRIQGGWLDFDVAVATQDVMGGVQRLGRLLGPRGLLPNPRTGTVVAPGPGNIARLIREVRSGRVEFRVDRTTVIHVPIGKASFEPERLRENLAAILDAIIRAKPQGARGQYIRTIALAPSMGPGVKLELQPALALTSATT